MKTKLFLFTALTTILLNSCSESLEDKIENDKIEYVSKATVFFNNMIEKDEKKEVQSISNIKVDSIVNLTEKEAGLSTLSQLNWDYKIAVKYAQDLSDIDEKFGQDMSTQTIAAIDEAVEIENHLNAETDKMMKLSDKVVGKQVYFTSDLKLSDGTMNKGFAFKLNFDLENDLPKKWNDLK